MQRKIDEDWTPPLSEDEELLHRAAQLGDEFELIRKLSQKGWDGMLNARDEYGRSALMCAAQAGSFITAGLLVKQDGVSLEIRSKRTGRTALGCATHWGHVKIVVLLMKAGADTCVGDREGMTPLHSAIHRGHGHVVLRMLELGGYGRAYYKKIADARRTAAIYTSNKHNKPSAKTDEDNGSTTGSVHSVAGEMDAVNITLVAPLPPPSRMKPFNTGPDVKPIKIDKGDKCGRTPLMVAAGLGRNDLVNMLMSRELCKVPAEPDWKVRL